MASRTKTQIFCSLLMAVLFAYSAAVQLNDSDWYFWLPLYSGACAVNLLLGSKTITSIAEADLCLGAFLFVKVVVEGFVNGIPGFWSLDLSERIVRENIGSGMVVVSMVLQLIASKNKDKVPRIVEYGMVFLVGFGFGLPFVFFMIQKGQM